MKILLLGSTGSIGTSALNCVRRFRDSFELVGFTVNNNIEDLAGQVNEFGVSSVCICSEEAAERARKKLPPAVKIFKGNKGLEEIVNETDFDILLNALVGAVGFRPTVAALKKKKRVALANKETLVIGGEIISSLLKEGYGELIPVDSEHSAILQCLNGEDPETIESITITASGGPFRDKNTEQFSTITPEEALNHPTWSMGNKITIDSATLINKGFEVIEAHFLFKLPYDRLHVMIHPQSIIHSMVTFHDGAVMAQCGIPDMELPIQYALSYPKRLPIMGTRLDLAEIGSLTFAEPDFNRFPCLKLCIDAGKQGGTLTTVLNAANEIAVQQFLKGAIGFNRIAEVIEQACSEHQCRKVETVEQIEEIDMQTRNQVLKRINK